MSTAAEAAKIVASKRDCASGPDPKSADPKATARRAKLLSGAQAREARIRLLVGPLIEQPERAQPAATRDMAASPEASALTCVSEPKQRLQSLAATAAAARRSRLLRDAATREAKILGISAADAQVPSCSTASLTLASELEAMPQLEVCAHAAQLRKSALKSKVEMKTSRADTAVAAAADLHDDDVSLEQVLLEIWHAKDCATCLQQHLAAGRDINSHHGASERSLLHSACCTNVSDVTGSSDTLVRLLLRAGADVNAVTAQGLTPLMITNCAEVVQCLLEHGAGLSAVSDCGMTALYLASNAGLTDSVKVMLKRPGAAELIVKQSSSELAPLRLTPLALALNNGHERTAVLLLKHALQLDNFSVNAPLAGSAYPLLISAVCAEMQQLVTLLLDSGAAVNTEIRGAVVQCSGLLLLVTSTC
jgi:Ankyrin repeats (3 copies)